ncbi:MAG: N-acetylmuramoyl-L-alanine amidase, partial [Catalinimonas sp.]
LAHIFFANMQSAYLENSLTFAHNVETQFEKRVGRHSRGVKQSPLIVLWRSAMPAVLVEVGFLTNPTEERYLNDELGRVYIASGIYRAFRDYKQEIESIE